MLSTLYLVFSVGGFLNSGKALIGGLLLQAVGGGHQENRNTHSSQATPVPHQASLSVWHSPGPGEELLSSGMDESDWAPKCFLFLKSGAHTRVGVGGN